MTKKLATVLAVRLFVIVWPGVQPYLAALARASVLTPSRVSRNGSSAAVGGPSSGPRVAKLARVWPYQYFVNSANPSFPCVLQGNLYNRVYRMDLVLAVDWHRIHILHRKACARSDLGT